MSDLTESNTSERSDDGPLPPGQSRNAGRIIAVGVFLGVIIGIAAIVLMPEQTIDREGHFDLEPNHSARVRLIGARGAIEIANDGPGAVRLTSPTEGLPITGELTLFPGATLRRDIRDVGVIEIANLSDAPASVRWRGGGPAPVTVDTEPVRKLE